jgi:hypothetical protein
MPPASLSGHRGHGSGRKPSSVPSACAEEMVICLGWSSPATSSSLPAASFVTLRFRRMVGVGHTSPPIWPCSDWGLPCRPCCQERGGLLPHRFTLTRRRPRGHCRAVYFLWPCPSPCGAQALPGSLPDGARTFLGGAHAPPRPSRPTRPGNIAASYAPPPLPGASRVLPGPAARTPATARWRPATR